MVTIGRNACSREDGRFATARVARTLLCAAFD
jgi:hypothetical protein